MWGPSATRPPAEREAWLVGEGRERLARLSAIVEGLGKPWRERSPLGNAPEPGPEWYRDYPA